MGNNQTSKLHGNLRAIFESGCSTGLGDAQLLDRFLDPENTGSQVAFESLVMRHGPMVLRVCRGILGNTHDAHDACQAVFLILARQARSIRHRDFLAGWLYRIAVRVAKRQRVRNRKEYALADQAARRGALRVVAAQTASAEETPNDFSEIVNEEVDRLDRKLREPVVLCYFEGLTHDEAAERLSWPVGTVRSRLARARDRLRVRLRRRGVSDTGTGNGVLGIWINLDPSIPLDAASSRLAEFVSNTPLPMNFVHATSEAAIRVASAPWSRFAVVPASAVASTLAKGVLQAMFYKKLVTASLVSVSLGVLAVGGGSMLGQTSQPSDSQRASLSDGKTTEAAPRGKPFEARAASSNDEAASSNDEVEKQLRELLKAAERRLEAQRPYWEQGRITVDRYLDAIAEVGKAEQALATSMDDYRRAQAQMVLRYKQVVDHERAALEAGLGTTSNLTESELRLEKAKLELKEMGGTGAERKDLRELAQKRYETQKMYFAEGRVTVDRFLDAMQQLCEVEKSMATTVDAKIDAQARAYERMGELLDQEKKDLVEGKSTQADLTEIELRRLQVGIELSRMKRHARIFTSSVGSSRPSPSIAVSPTALPASDVPDVPNPATLPPSISRKPKGIAIERESSSLRSSLDTGPQDLTNPHDAEIRALNRRVGELEARLNALIQGREGKPAK